MTITPLSASDAAYRSGLEAMNAGEYRDALAQFNAAYEGDHNPATLRNLAEVYKKLEQPHAAVQALENYLAQADAERDAEGIVSARADIEQLRSASGRIGVNLIPEHASVELDGEPVTLRGGELLAAPGKRHITAHADGYKSFDQVLDVQAGQFSLEIQLEKVDMSPKAAADAAPEPAVTKPTAPQTEPTDEPEQSAASSCLLDKVCLGPVVALLGPPNLLGGGLHARIGRYLGVGVDYQVLPTLNFSPVAVGTSLFSANARVYPFGGAFFLGAGMGYQSIHGQLRQGEISVTARSGFPALMANFGFMGHDGFVLGADLGLLFPLGTMRATVHEDLGSLAATAGVAQSEIDSARSKAESGVNKIFAALPFSVQLNLLRLGYMF